MTCSQINKRKFERTDFIHFYVRSVALHAQMVTWVLEQRKGYHVKSGVVIALKTVKIHQKLLTKSFKQIRKTSTLHAELPYLSTSQPTAKNIVSDGSRF